VSERLVAIVPLRALEGAKSRLGEALDAEERRDLVVDLLERTVRAAAATPGIDEVLVVSPDPAVLVLAADVGAHPLRQVGSGLNAALEEARRAAVADGATALLVLPADLPRLAPGTLLPLVALARGVHDGSGEAGRRALVALVPDRHGRGTNALLLVPPDTIGFAFGGDSRSAHAALAASAGAAYIEVDGPLSLDLDTPDDLLIDAGAGAAPA
jgi:2-phospho-L-lactate guanylyltransferase